MTLSLGMPPVADLATILAADVGSTRTKVALFGQQGDGRWALLGASAAYSTAGSPREGLMGGIITAANEVQRATGMRLVSDERRLAAAADRTIVACGSGAPPLSVVMLAPTAARSARAGLLATRWSYVAVQDAATMDAALESGNEGRWADMWHPAGALDVVAGLLRRAPDAVMVVGGYDGGATAPLVDMCRLLSSARPAGHPPLTVVFAGNELAAGQVAHLLAGRADVRLAANVLPAPDAPQPQSAGEALDDLYSQRKLGALNGQAVLSGLCASPILSTARALALAWDMMSELWDAPVIGLDIGARTTIAGLFTPGERYHLNVGCDMGAYRGWIDAERDLDPLAIARWLPIPLGKTEIQMRLAASHERPFIVPETDDEHLLQEAMVREAWRRQLPPDHNASAAANARPKARHIVGSGGPVANAPTRWRRALMLLDAVEPRGLVHLWLDEQGVLAQIGAVSSISRTAATSLLGGTTICDLGLAICLDGATTPGRKAADIEMELPDGSIRRTIAAWGTLHHLATGGLGEVTLTIRLARGVYLPGYEGEPTIVLKINGGELGVILDCRGRPLDDQLASDHSHTRVHAWIAASAE